MRLIAAALLCFSILAPNAGAATAAGADAIRAQLPIILASRYGGVDKVVVGKIVTDGTDGYALYKVGNTPGYAVIHLRDGKWWLLATGEHFDPGIWTDPPRVDCGIVAWCLTIPLRRPSAQELIDRYHFSAAFAESAIALLELPSETPPPALNGSLVRPGIHIDVMPPLHPPTDKPAAASFTATSADPARILDTTMTASSASQARGAIVEVWAPYEFDASKEYVLTVGVPSQKPQHITGSLARNTLHFVVPAIPAPPEAAVTLAVAVATTP